MSAAILAFGAISALGEGVLAASAGEVGEPAKLGITRDAELERAGLARPFVARAQIAIASENGRIEDRATVVLRRALVDCMHALDLKKPGWRAQCNRRPDSTVSVE